MDSRNKERTAGEVKNFNPNKQISVEIVLDILLKHKNAVHKAYYGRDISEPEVLNDNLRILNQAKALRDMISSQKMIVDLIARPVLEENCIERWKKKNKTAQEKEKNPFENEENDLRELLNWRTFLNNCFEALRQADLTPTQSDDFMISKTKPDGSSENYLTDNFYEMRDDLAESYNMIYRLMIRHEIVTQKEQEDEELTSNEQEELFLERFKEA